MLNQTSLRTAFNYVRIDEGGLQIDPAVAHYLRHVLAPTRDPQLQLQHLEWLLGVLGDGTDLQEQDDRLLLHAVQQLKTAIQLSAGAPGRAPYAPRSPH